MRRKIIERFLRKRGQKISPAVDLDGRTTRKAALGRLQARHIPVRTVIDAGASDGRWSADALRFYPKARYLCIEAQAAHEGALKALASQNSRMEYVICAA